MSWEPQVGEKCEWQRDTDEWVVVNVLAVQNTEVCIDDGRLMQVVSRAALRPLAPAPEPPKPPVDRKKLVEALDKAYLVLPMASLPHSGAWAEKVADALLPLFSGGDAELRAEVERLRAALPTEEEILAMRYLKGYAHLCDTPEVETFRAYLARTEAQA